MEEIKLIAELKERKQEAFKCLVDMYQAKIYNTCLGMLQNSGDAEDLTQEIFIVIYNSVTHFKSDSKLSTWIYRITINKSLEFIRSKKRKKRFAMVQNLFYTKTDAEENEFEPAHFYHPGVQLENKELSVILFQALNKIPENQKTAFILHKLEDQSYAEIAEIMNTTVSSVESLMFRAKQNLQKVLGDYYEKNYK